jgi:hypothetical protein
LGPIIPHPVLEVSARPELPRVACVTLGCAGEFRPVVQGMMGFLRRTRGTRLLRRRTVGAGPAGHVIMVLSGLRQPIVLILLLIAFFSTISGKPLDGLLMLLVAAGLAWDDGKRSREAGGQSPATKAGRAEDQSPATKPGRAEDQSPATKAGLAGGQSAAPPPSRRRRAVLAVTWLAGGALYAAVVGSFSRYSWPATAGVVALGAIVVLIGWPGPLRFRPDPGRLPLPGTALWGGLLVAGGLWELGALIQQPGLTVSSSAHPTISTLTDPLLSSHGGRSVALAVWLLLGWLLVER